MSQIHGYHPFQGYTSTDGGQHVQNGQGQSGNYYAQQQPSTNAYYSQPPTVGTNGYAPQPPHGYGVAMNGYIPPVTPSTQDIKPNLTNPNTNGKKAQTSAGPAGGVGKWQGPVSTASSSAPPLPPVKNACISCRTRKARCDGVQPVCGQCSTRDRDCVFVKSRRGGKRVRKAAVQAIENAPAPSPLSIFLQKLDGLLLPPSKGYTTATSDAGAESDVGEKADKSRILRNLDSLTLRQLLTLHYDEIHGFLPLLPHRRHFEEVLAYLPRPSAMLFAVKAILFLVPNEQDPEPNSKPSKKVRAAASFASARQAYDLIDTLSAVIEEGEEYDEQTAAKLKLDMVQALTMLCLWEWGQTLDLAKNKLAANRAIQMAMDMGLHQLDKGKTPDAYAGGSPAPSGGRRNSMHSNASSWEMPTTQGRSLEGVDWQMDMKRRTWWIGFMGMMTSAVVGGSRPLISPDDNRIKTDYPITTLNDTAWPNWIETIRICSRCIDLIISLDSSPVFTSDADSNSHAVVEERRRIKRELVAIDRNVVEWMKQAEATSIIELVPGAEEEVVRNQQLSARFGCAVMHIQIHKRQAFPEVSLFSKKICGFPKNKIVAALRGEGPSARLSPATSSLLAQSPRDSSPPSASPTSGVATGSSMNPSPVLGSQGTMFGGMDAKALGFDYNMLSDTTPVDYSFPGSQSNGDMNVMMDGLLWDPTAFPGSIPQPWFASPKGAAGLWNPLEVPASYGNAPIFDSSLVDMNFFYNSLNGDVLNNPLVQDPAWAQQMQSLQLGQAQQQQQQQSSSAPPYSHDPAFPAVITAAGPSTSQYNASTVTTISTGRQAINRVSPTHRSESSPHRAWGVDLAKPPSPDNDGSAIEEDEGDDDEIFPPGVSLARCAAAAHAVVRLEVLHRSASMALWKGTPKWLPFCACGLVAGAYSFLLLALAVQAENQFSPRSSSKSEEIRALLTNVKVILAGLEAYGTMWDGIGAMAVEVRNALEAASALPEQVEAEEQQRLQ